MRNIILVSWGGYFDKRKIQTKHIIEKYHIGYTSNGIPKYKWNFWMWFNTLLNKIE